MWKVKQKKNQAATQFCHYNCQSVQTYLQPCPFIVQPAYVLVRRHVTKDTEQRKYLCTYLLMSYDCFKVGGRRGPAKEKFKLILMLFKFLKMFFLCKLLLSFLPTYLIILSLSAYDSFLTVIRFEKDI